MRLVGHNEIERSSRKALHSSVKVIGGTTEEAHYDASSVMSTRPSGVKDYCVFPFGLIIGYFPIIGPKITVQEYGREGD